jgi:uncharacterized protein (UPF0548 family)
VLRRGRQSFESLLDVPFTYADVGATASARQGEPAGYHHVRRSEVIGHGLPFFASAADALMSWQMHRGAGLHVTASQSHAARDVVVLMRLGVGPFGIRVPCRVVYEVAEARRIGFAYGTLRGHPESGEERFIVELSDDEQVLLQITAFSRPGRWFTKLGGPVGRCAQALMTDRYVRTLRRS